MSIRSSLPEFVLAPDVVGTVLGVGHLDGDDRPRLGGVVVVVGVADGYQIWNGVGLANSLGWVAEEGQSCNHRSSHIPRSGLMIRESLLFRFNSFKNYLLHIDLILASGHDWLPGYT